MADEAQDEGLYNEADLAEGLLPVIESPDFQSLPAEEAVAKLKEVYDRGEGQFTPEAKALLADQADKVWLSRQEEPNLDWLSEIEKPKTEGLSEEDQSAAWDTWNEQVKKNVAEENEGDYLLIQKRAEKALDTYTRQQKRLAEGADTTLIGDLPRRILGGAAQFGIGSVLGFKETGQEAADYFEANPKYDDTFYAQVAEGLGQAPIQVGIPAVIAAVGAATIGAPAFLTMGAVSAGIAGIASYRDTFDNVYEKTGSTQMASEAGVENAFTNGAIEALSGALIQKRIIQPWVEGLSSVSKKKYLASKIGEGFAIEAPTEALQDVGQQFIEAQRTGAEYDPGRSIRAGLVGGAVGGIIGGGLGATTRVKSDLAPQSNLNEEVSAPTPEITGDAKLEAIASGEEPLAVETEEITSLGVDEQILLTSRVDEFATSEQERATIPGYEVFQVPPELLDIHPDLKMRDVEEGIELIKSKPERPYPQLEYEEDVEITPELNEKRLKDELTSLAVRAVNLPTEAQMRSRLNYNEKLRLDAIEGMQNARNPIAYEVNQTEFQRLSNLIPRQRQELKQEQKTGKMARERIAIRDRATQIEELINKPAIEKAQAVAVQNTTPVLTKAVTKGEVTQEDANKIVALAPNNETLQTLGKDLITKGKKPIQVVENTLKLASTNEQVQTELKTPVLKGQKQLTLFPVETTKALSTAEAATELQVNLQEAVKNEQVPKRKRVLKEKLQQVENFTTEAPGKAQVEEAVVIQNDIAESRKILSDNKISESVNPALKDLINYWTSGFKIKEAAIGTVNDLKNGNLEKIADPILWREFTEARSKGKFNPNKVGGAAFVSSDGKTLIVLENGDYKGEAARVAGHETGHLIFRTIWKQAPEKTKGAVLQDYLKATKIEDLKKMTVDEIANRLIGPGSPFAGMTEGAANLSSKDRSYLLNFEEFFANRVSKFLTDPNAKPATLAENLYSKIADGLRKIWRSVQGLFAESKTLEDWLTDTFNPDRSFINADFPRGADQAQKNEKGTKERKFTKRVRQSPVIVEPVKKAVGKVLYKPQSSLAELERAKAKINPTDIESNIREVLDFGNKLNPQQRIALGSAVMEELQTQIKDREAKNENAETLYLQQERLAKGLAEEGAQLGRGVQAFTLFKWLGYPGFKRMIKRDLRKMLGLKEDADTPDVSPEVDVKLKEIFATIQAVEKAAGTTDTSMITAELMREASALASRDIPGNPLNALSYYWYANMLSGLSTQTINFFGSGMNLFLKSLATAITNPKGASAFISGLAKGSTKGLKAGRAVFAGRAPVTRAKFEVESLKRSIPPLASFENSMANALVAKPLNFFNSKLQYVTRLMNAVDAAFYRTAAEGQAYLAASKVLRQKGITRENLAERISEELHNSTAEFKAAMEQSRKEWVTSKLKFKERDVELRAYEIIEGKRSEAIQEIANRFGRISTYTEAPAGTLGIAARQINALIKELPGTRIIFPFVNVVSNVLSQSLDFSPIGVIRGLKGSHILGRNKIPFNPQEKLQRLGSGIIGTTLAAAIYGAAQAELDDENPDFGIWARGPQNKGKKEALKAKGWVPYSIKIGGDYIKYSETPLAPILAWIGELHDASRYSPSFNKKNPGEKFVYGLQNVAGVVLDTGFLRSASNLLEIMNGDRNPNTLISSALKPLIPFQGLARDLAKTTDNYELDPKATSSAYLRGLPFIGALGIGQPALNGFGEPMRTPRIAEGDNFIESLPDRIITPTVGRFLSTEKSDPNWDYLAKGGAYIPQMATTTSVGLPNPNYGEKRKIKKNQEERLRTLGRAAYDTLTYDEIYEITKKAGPEIKKGVEKLRLRKPDLSGEKLQSEVEKIVAKARREAKADLFNY